MHDDHPVQHQPYYVSTNLLVRPRNAKASAYNQACFVDDQYHSAKTKPHHPIKRRVATKESRQVNTMGKNYIVGERALKQILM